MIYNALYDHVMHCRSYNALWIMYISHCVIMRCIEDHTMHYRSRSLSPIIPGLSPMSTATIDDRLCRLESSFPFFATTWNSYVPGSRPVTLAQSSLLSGSGST